MVAEQHGGHIELDTSPGNGATFVITLPMGHPRPVDQSG
jgi:signal transduction histidine kinase